MSVELAHLEHVTEHVESFSSMGLRDSLLKGISAFGFEKPSKTQTALTYLTAGRDAIIYAPSGTGKSSASVIACLQAVNASIESCQALILIPHESHADHVLKTCMGLAQFMGVSCGVFVDGQTITIGINELVFSVQVVVGTPNMVYDMVEKGHLKTKLVKVLSLINADDILAQHCRMETVCNLFDRLPENIQVIACTTTSNNNVLEFTRNNMRNPGIISDEQFGMTLEGVKHFYIAIDKLESKLETLMDILNSIVNVCSVIVYCNTRKRVAQLADNIQACGFTVCILHADIDSEERDLRIREFRSGSDRVLISTDLPGTDEIPKINCVINYELPLSIENYLHRNGRKRNFVGTEGITVSFVTPEDKDHFHAIQRRYQISIDVMPVDIVNYL